MIKRKLWIEVFGKLEIKEIYRLAEKQKLKVLMCTKPNMMIDIMFGVKGKKEDIDRFKTILISEGHAYKTRCPKRSFNFII